MKFLNVMILGVFLSNSMAQTALAGNFGCESVAGSVIFKDTMYGVLTGGVLSGLFILAEKKDKRQDVEEKLSLGAAIGGGFGLGLGIAEVAMRDCPQAALDRRGARLGVILDRPTLNSPLSPGFQLSYRW